MRCIQLAALLLVLPAAMGAQSTKERVEKAKAHFENFEVEAARPLLSEIFSSSYPLRVEPEDRVEAYKYLGASYAVLGQKDSAVTFFQAALDFDPFTDLDPSKFTSLEQTAFSDAKLRIFKIGIQPITSLQRLDSTFTFKLTTTQRAQLTVELVNQRDSTRETLFDGQSLGRRDIPWRGILSTGRFADSTTYELIVRATPQGSASPTTDRQRFRIEHSYRPLEDTLPSLSGADLLPVQYPSSAAWADLAKGLFAGSAAYMIPSSTFSDDLGWKTHSITAAAIGIGIGTVWFLYRRQNRDISQNVAENRRREAQRAAFNGSVRARNTAKLNQTILIIAPPIGGAQ